MVSYKLLILRCFFSSNVCALYKTNVIYWTIAVITTLWETDADVIQNIFVTSEELIQYKISRGICRRFQYYFLKVANSLKLCWYLQIHWIIQGFPTKMLKTWLFWRGWKFDLIGNFPFPVKISTCQYIFLLYKPQLQTILAIFHRTSPSSFC